MKLFRRKDSTDSGGGVVPPPESYVVRRGPERDEVADRLAAAAPGVADELVTGLLPAVRFGVRPMADSEIPVGASKVGGAPDLPVRASWPGGAGVRFFAQVDLAAVAAVAYGPVVPGLPEDGLLSFFAAFDDDDWAPDSGAAVAVVHVPAGTPLVRFAEPVDPVKAARLGPVGVWTWPELELSGREYDAVDAADIWHEEQIAAAVAGAFATEGRHQLGGHARSVQGVFDAELLFQLDSDDALDVMWADAGTLYWLAPLATPTFTFQTL